MEGFSFEPRTRVSVCGRVFELSLMDSTYLQALLEAYGQIVQVQARFGQAQALLGAPEPTPQQVCQAGEELVTANEELLRCTRRFLKTALGQEGYRQVFEGRPANAAEHLQLCRFLFEALTQGQDGDEPSLQSLYDDECTGEEGAEDDR